MKRYSLALVGLLVAAVASAATENPPAPVAAPAAKTFTVAKELWTTPFKSQAESFTCWCFGATSFFESEAHRLGRGDFELSPMFTVYHAYLEKALRHVRTHGTNRFSDGGLSHDVIHLIRNYGAVPRSSYTGLLGTAQKHDHRELHAVAKGLVAGVIKAGEEAPLSGQWTNGRFSGQWFNALRGTLDAYLGPPPAAIALGGKTLTPRQFADEVLRLPLDDYVEITSYSQLPFYGSGELLISDNWLHQSVHNLPLVDFMRLIDRALANGFSLVFDLHLKLDEMKAPSNFVLALDEDEGVSVTQDRRDSLLESWRTEDVHLVHAIGVATDETGKRFYKVKDSLGADAGDTSEYYNKEYLSEAFVRSRVLFVLVHKDALPTDLRRRLGLDKN